MNFSQFENNYKLDEVANITLANFDIPMLVTPRFQNQFTTPDPNNITMNLVRNLSQNCDIFIDVGAHYGQLALIAGKDNPRLKTIALEPSLENWEILKRNPQLRDINNISFGWLLDHIHTLIQINPDSILPNTISIPWGAVAAYLMQKPPLWLVPEYGLFNHGLIFFLPFHKTLQLIEQSSDNIITNARGIKDTLYPHISAHIGTTNFHIDITTVMQGSAIDYEYYIANLITSHIFMSGTVVPSKEQGEAVRAVVELTMVLKRNIKLVIIGDIRPDLKDFLQTLLKDADDENYVHFFPFQKDATKIAQSSDIILVCSRMEVYDQKFNFPALS